MKRLTTGSNTCESRVLRLMVLVALLIATAPGALVASPFAAENGAPDITGTVTDSDTGDPIAGAMVRGYHMAWAPWEGGGPRMTQWVVTDANGRYTLEVDFDVVVRPGEEDFWVQAYADGYIDSRVDFGWDAEEVAEVDIELEAGELSVFGTVVEYFSGDPIPDIGVSLSFTIGEGDDEEFVGWERVSAADGSFAFHGLPADTEFNVAVFEPGYEEYRETYFFDGSEPFEVDVALRVADPYFTVDPARGALEGWNWASGAELTIAIGDAGDPDFETTATATDAGGWGVWIDPDEQHDLAPGDVVTVSSEDVTKTHVVTGLAVTGVYTGDDVVSGEAAADARVTVRITRHYRAIEPHAYVSRSVEADEQGEWFADFSATFDITDRTGGHALEWDADGDATRAEWGFDLENLGPVLEVEGGDRYETAVEASRLAFPGSADTVVIATGRNWPDALGATALAGALDAPILLVSTGSVPGVVLEEIERLNASDAVIVGGTVAVGEAVETVLEEAGLAVERVAGGSRYETADAVALRVIEELGDDYDGTAFVATGAAYADAVACAPLAAANGWPLFLAHPAGGLSAATQAAMDDVAQALVLGGELAVTADTFATLEAALGAGNVERIAGTSRYGTAVFIAEYGVAEAGLSWDRVGIATGQSFPDALAGGVLQGKAGSVMLLTRTASLSPEAGDALTANADEIATVTYFGGPMAVSELVRDQVAQLRQ